MTRNRALIAALMTSATYFGLGATPASAVSCTIATDVLYDGCVGGLLNTETITLTGPATHDGTLAALTNANLIIAAGGSITNDTGGLWGTGMALTIATGGSMTLDGVDASGTGGFDTFASLAGGGTLTLTGGALVFGGNNANTAFSGTVVVPALANFLFKTGTGTWTVNGMTMAEGDLRIATGGLANTGGVTNIKSIGMGTGVGGNATTTMSGGTLNITGTFAGGPPCGSGCPSLRVGDFFGTGVFNQSGGTVNIGGAGVAGSLNIGNQTGNGTYNMSGGTLNMGVVGDINSAGLHSVGRQASVTATHDNGTTTGVFAITGGTVNVNSGELINGDRDAGGAVNVTTNSTINLSGGTLSVKAGANLWLSAHNNNAAVDSRFNLSGTGVLEVGDGRLQAGYLGGAGVYEFNLNGGQIRVIDSDLTTTVNAILLGASAATGTQINTNGLNANWNGVLSGAGWIVKTGAGTLHLGGPGNTYTGGMAFNGGIVVVDATADLGAVGSAMSFNGGTLQLGASNILFPKTGGIAMAGAGTIDTNGFGNDLNMAITGSGALTKVGAGILALNVNNNAHTGALNINAGVVSASNGNAIGDTSAVTVAAGATLNVEFGGTETIGSLAGAGNVQIRDNKTLVTGGNGASTTYSGVLSEAFGTSSLIKTGTGTFTVNANTAYTGLTTVSQGTMLLNGTMADGLLVAAGATFGGNATVTGAVTNNGRIAPGNSPGTHVYLGNYTAGVGAIFDMEVIFNSANLPVNGTTHDFVTMTNPGATITGTTLLNIIPFAPSNAAQPTVGNGIELVRVAAPVVGTQFQLAAPVFVGGYQYVLAYVPSAGPDSWFLRSQVGEGVFGAAAVFSAGQAMTSSCFGAGEELASADTKERKRAWAKGNIGGRETGADTGLTSKQDFACGSGGIDLRGGDNMRFGVMGGYGDTEVDVTTLAGVGKLDGDGIVTQLYAVYLRDRLYATMQLGYGTYEWTFDGPLTAPTTAETSGILAAFETGMRWSISEAWRFGLGGRIAYDGMSCESNCMLAGLTDDPAEWSAKAAARLDGNMGSWRTFASLGLSDRFGENSVTVGTVTTTTDTESAMLDLSAGIGVRLASDVEFFVGGHYGESLDKDTDQFDGNGGIKVVW